MHKIGADASEEKKHHVEHVSHCFLFICLNLCFKMLQPCLKQTGHEPTTLDMSPETTMSHKLKPTKYEPKQMIIL